MVWKSKWKQRFESEAIRALTYKTRYEQSQKDLEDAYEYINRLRNELHERNKVRFTDASADYPRGESATSASNREDYFDQSQVVRDVQKYDKIEYVTPYTLNYNGIYHFGTDPYKKGI